MDKLEKISEGAKKQRIEDIYPNLKDFAPHEEMEALNIAFDRGKFSPRDAIYLSVAHEKDNPRRNYYLKDRVVMTCKVGLSTVWEYYDNNDLAIII